MLAWDVDCCIHIYSFLYLHILFSNISLNLAFPLRLFWIVVTLTLIPTTFSLILSHPIYILSTGLNPNTFIPLFNTCLAATYSANRAIMTFRSLPTTCRWS